MITFSLQAAAMRVARDSPDVSVIVWDRRVSTNGLRVQYVAWFRKQLYAGIFRKSYNCASRWLTCTWMNDAVGHVSRYLRTQGLHSSSKN